MRVGIIALQHESNTFLATPTTWDDFERGAILTGAAIRQQYAESHHEVGGFFQGLEEAGLEAVPIFLAWAPPSGVVTGPTLNKLLFEVFAHDGRSFLSGSSAQFRLFNPN